MNKIAIWEFIPISRHPYTIMGPIFCSWLFMINVTFIVRPSMLKRNLTVKMWAEKNFDTFLNLENYEPLRLPWKIRKKLKSQAAASYLTAMNALQVEKTWCTSLWRKISLRSKQWQQIPRKPWGIQPSTEIVDAPSGWSNLALTMIDFRMVKPCKRKIRLLTEIPKHKPQKLITGNFSPLPN